MTDSYCEQPTDKALEAMECRAPASTVELLAIADRAASQIKGPYVDHSELLYDERGLPK